MKTTIFLVVAAVVVLGAVGVTIMNSATPVAHACTIVGNGARTDVCHPDKDSSSGFIEGHHGRFTIGRH
jgi:hypothetical protein